MKIVATVKKLMVHLYFFFKRRSCAPVSLCGLCHCLRVDAIDPEVHLPSVSCLEQVVATRGQSQPEDVFLLGVVEGHVGGAVGQVDGGLPLEGLLGVVMIGLLVLIARKMLLLHDYTHFLP